MCKPMTKEQLAAHDGISPEDKELIEQTIDWVLGEDDDLQSRCLRAYLVALWEESEPDDQLRQEIGGDAASWLDGWSYGATYGDPVVGVCRVCGCTDDNACLDAVTNEPCFWVEDDLCSACWRKINAGPISLESDEDSD